LRAYQTSLELNRHQPDALRELGELHAFGGDFQKAEEEFRRGIALDPKNALLHQELGNSLLKSGKPVDAEPELREAVKLHSRAGLAHRDLGLALPDKGDLQGAIQEFRRAVALMPENAPVHYQFSQTLRRAGKKYEADREAALSEKFSHEKEEVAQALAYANQGLSLVQNRKPRTKRMQAAYYSRRCPRNLTKTCAGAAVNTRIFLLDCVRWHWSRGIIRQKIERPQHQ
jgi:Flp pilus assembly protein TadD